MATFLNLCFKAVKKTVNHKVLKQLVSENNCVLTSTDVTKLQTAHFTDCAPYWYMSNILQFPQFTCAT